jgi:hypothetical protein
MEAPPVEDVMAVPIGVLGQSANGSGVRGNGGPLLPIPFAADLIVETTPNVPLAIDLTLGATGNPASANLVPPLPIADGMLLIGAGATTAEFQPLASFTVGKETSFQYTLTNAAGDRNHSDCCDKSRASDCPAHTSADAGFTSSSWRGVQRGAARESAHPCQ